MPAPTFVIVRTDLSGDEGMQRVVGWADDEVAAVREMDMISNRQLGDYAVARVGEIVFEANRPVPPKQYSGA